MRKYHLSILDSAGVVLVLFILAGLAWVPLTLAYCKHQDIKRFRQDAMLDAQKRIHDDMLKACSCWYTDSRCRAPATKVVVCSMPEFMRQVP